MLLVVHGRRITEMKRNNLLWTAARSEATSKVTDRASAEDGGVHSDGNLNGMYDAGAAHKEWYFCLVFFIMVYVLVLYLPVPITGVLMWSSSCCTNA